MEKQVQLTPSHEKIKNTPPKTRKDLMELKDILANRTRIQMDVVKSAGDTINTESFKGEKIQVIPDFKDKTVIYMKTSLAQIQLDLHYDETREGMDSLRKDVIVYPEISITAEVDGELYEVSGYDEETSVKIAAELLKQIERKKNPEIFGYKEIHLGMLEDNTIIVGGKRADGNAKRLGFFDFIDDEKDRIMLYGYISHYFGKPLDPKVFEDGESPDENNKKNDGGLAPKDKDWSKSA